MISRCLNYYLDFKISKSYIPVNINDYFDNIPWLWNLKYCQILPQLPIWILCTTKSLDRNLHHWQKLHFLVLYKYFVQFHITWQHLHNIFLHFCFYLNFEKIQIKLAVVLLIDLISINKFFRATIVVHTFTNTWIFVSFFKPRMYIVNMK